MYIYTNKILYILSVGREKGLTTSQINIHVDPFASKLTTLSLLHSFCEFPYLGVLVLHALFSIIFRFSGLGVFRVMSQGSIRKVPYNNYILGPYVDNSGIIVFCCFSDCSFFLVFLFNHQITRIIESYFLLLCKSVNNYVHIFCTKSKITDNNGI